jgi:hypothetical protein
VHTHTPLKPISNPRGYPDDFPLVNDQYQQDTSSLSERERGWYAKYPEDYQHEGGQCRQWMGDHSHS